MKNSYFVIVLLVFVTSCKTVYINKQQQKVASSAIELATIGEGKMNLEINAFQTTSIPTYKKKLRISSQILEFSNATFRAFKNASKLQGKKVSVKYVDSLPNKPVFVTISISDKVSVINQLNENFNKEVLSYLQTVPEAKMISTVSMVFTNKLVEEIREAEEVYLVNKKFKKYDLQLYKNKKLFKTIDLSKGTVFAYQWSSFCWSKNGRELPKLVNLNFNSSKCKNNTYNSYLEANPKPKPQKIKF